MKKLALSLALVSLSLAPLLAFAGCASSSPPDNTSAPGHGAVSIQVIPNPIVATQVSGNTYDFPFEVVIRETGGRPVTVQRVTATVVYGGGLPLGSESWDANRIRSMGYNTTLAAHSETRYKFSQRKEVPDDRLFGGVSAELRVEAIDDTGSAANATTSVTVRK